MSLAFRILRAFVQLTIQDYSSRSGTLPVRSGESLNVLALIVLSNNRCRRAIHLLLLYHLDGNARSRIISILNSWLRSPLHDLVDCVLHVRLVIAGFALLWLTLVLQLRHIDGPKVSLQDAARWQSQST